MGIWLRELSFSSHSAKHRCSSIPFHGFSVFVELRSHRHCVHISLPPPRVPYSPGDWPLALPQPWTPLTQFLSVDPATRDVLDQWDHRACGLLRPISSTEQHGHPWCSPDQRFLSAVRKGCRLSPGSRCWEEPFRVIWVCTCPWPCPLWVSLQ